MPAADQRGHAHADGLEEVDEVVEPDRGTAEDRQEVAKVMEVEVLVIGACTSVSEAAVIAGRNAKRAIL